MCVTDYDNYPAIAIVYETVVNATFEDFVPVVSVTVEDSVPASNTTVDDSVPAADDTIEDLVFGAYSNFTSLLTQITVSEGVVTLVDRNLRPPPMFSRI